MSKAKPETEQENTAPSTASIEKLQSRVEDLETAIVQYKSLYEQEYATARRAEELLLKWQDCAEHYATRFAQALKGYEMTKGVAEFEAERRASLALDLIRSIERN